VELLRRIKAHNIHVLTYVFVCVELGYGISGSDTYENPDENPTVVEAVGFHSETLDIEKLEIHRLEDVGLCDGKKYM
jgi:hypothetical protein